MTSGNDGVYPISNNAKEDRSAYIVFVHGLGGQDSSVFVLRVIRHSSSFVIPTRPQVPATYVLQ